MSLICEGYSLVLITHTCARKNENFLEVETLTSPAGPLFHRGTPAKNSTPAAGPPYKPRHWDKKCEQLWT